MSFPPAGQSCSACYYWDSRADPGVTGLCCNSRPNIKDESWRTTKAANWCGDGADATTGKSYSQPVSGIPGTGGAGPGYMATSVTSLAIASSGSLAPTTQLNLAYTAGARVRLTSTGSAAWMEGIVTNYSAAGVLTFTADLSSGAGSHTDWNINLAGARGTTGAGVGSTGTFTFTATPLVVSDAAVAANSIILLIPTNDAAGILVGGHGGTGNAFGVFISSKSAGVSFTVTVATGGGGGGSSGTETFAYVNIVP